MSLSQLGPYKIGRTLGRGGMGVVYEGTDSESGTKAAVKVLSAPLAAQDDFRERFEVEIEALRKLRHPNIVRIFGFGEQDNHLFYSMELVDGPSLEEEIRHGRQFDWREVTQIGVKICRALKHAHDRGIIHRDIKPANLLVTSEREVKLSDFGIAKLFGLSGLTAERGTLGTAEYMAPEQIDGRRITERSDLYSLGGVLYTLLAGRPPLLADTLLEMLQLQRFAEPDPVRVYAPETPKELEQIITELLAKDPEQRIRNALLLSRRLEAMQHGLLRRAELEGTRTTEQEDFVLGEGAAGGKTHDGSPDAGKTDAPSSAPNEFSAPVDPRHAAADTVPATGLDAGSPEHSHQPALRESADSEEAPVEAERTPPAQRFTVVTETEDEPQRESPLAVLFSAQTAVLAAALVAVGLGIWFFLQPASADRLYQRVMAQVEEGETESLLNAEDDIREFLENHPADSRSIELGGYLEEIELYRLERKFERRASRLATADDLAPVERAYLEAINHVRLSPAEGMARLEALLVLFADEEAESEKTKMCLELARRRLERIKDQVGRQAAAQLTFIHSQLDEAQRLSSSEPAKARAIRQAVIELYGEKPWAREAVDLARRALEASPVGSDAEPP